jgi:hypothetical protein
MVQIHPHDFQKALILEVSDEKIEKRRKEMMQFNFTCRDGTGRGAAITGPLKDAGIHR